MMLQTILRNPITIKDSVLTKLLQLHHEILNLTKSDIFCSHISHLISIKTLDKVTRVTVRRDLAEIEYNEDSDELEMNETNKICAVSKIYKAFEANLQNHELILSVILKHNGEIDMEGHMNPFSFDDTQNQKKSSPMKAHGANLQLAGGDNKSNVDIKTEGSDVSMRSDTSEKKRERDPVIIKKHEDRDFQNLVKVLNAPEDIWQREVKTLNCKIYRKKDFKGTALYLVKSVVNLPGIPKEVAFNAVADIYTRRKWDTIVANATVLEQDKQNQTCVYRYPIPTPAFLEPREAVILSKVKKDFPYPGMWSLHNSSVQHSKWPENPAEFVRVDLVISGFVFEDAPEVNGCKMRWVIQNDLKGTVPKAWVNQRALKNPQRMMENLYEACTKIMQGKL